MFLFEFAMFLLSSDQKKIWVAYDKKIYDPVKIKTGLGRR